MKEAENPNYNVIIIGGGPAGISAALWCAELGLKAVLLESSNELGGQLLWTYNAIKNHLGIEAENGREMQQIFLRQIQERDFELLINCEVIEIDTGKRQVKLKTDEILSADNLVIATGIKRRKLNLENEDSFLGKGIITSGKRDAEKVKGKSVCIIGGGDAALENALILAEFASQVTLVHRRKDFRGRSEFIEKVKQNEKVKILTETVVNIINGEDFLESLELQNLQTKQTFTQKTDFLLLRLGVEPNTELLRGKVQLDKNGYCLIDSHCRTNLEKVFAIGDVASPIAPTISTAVGMGACVAKFITQETVF